jgi:acetyl esterase
MTHTALPSEGVVPLENVAPDAVDLISAFRAGGSIGFEDLPLKACRAAYQLSCATNGVPADQLEHIEDAHCSVQGGSIRLRHYAAREAGSGAAQPVVVFLHGGGWVIGSLETHDRICRRLSAVSGLDVISVDYRLAPEHPFPTPLEDCIAALKYVRDRAPERGWDVSRVIVAGDSAGGNLATVIATDPDCSVEGIRIIGQLLLYPVTNLLHESASYSRIAKGFPLTAGSMRWFRKMYLPNGTAADDLRVSPGLRTIAELAASGAPAAFVVTVGLDPLADEGVAYAGLLAHAMVPVEHHHLPRHSHGLFTSAGKIPTGAQMLDRAGEWLSTLATTDRITWGIQEPTQMGN